MKARLLLVGLLIAACLGGVGSILSKSDRSKKEKVAQKPAKVEEPLEDYAVEEQEEGEMVPDDEEKANILDNHDVLDVGARKFPADRMTLGYVTPWNNHGYDVAKWAAKKFSHISPVWFQLKPGEIDALPSCTIGGTHDIDRGWMDDILKNNSEAKMVPRFLFEGWGGDQLKHFLTDEQTQHRCGRALIDFLLRNEFSGAVMEVWLQVMSVTRGSAAEYMLEIIEGWGEEFRRAGLIFILPLPPPLDEKLEQVGSFSTDFIKRLLDAVDYVNVMTYDFPSPDLAGVSPIRWAEANVRFFLRMGGEDFDAARILFGLNFYGYNRSGGKAESITGNRFLDFLRDPTSALEFDTAGAEHRVRWGSDSVAYFPTAKSLQLRVELAAKMGVGVAIWELGQGLDYFTSVL